MVALRGRAGGILPEAASRWLWTLLPLVLALLLASCDAADDDDSGLPIDLGTTEGDSLEEPDHPGRINGLHLWAEDCVRGDVAACDELVRESREVPGAAAYQSLGERCGGRVVVPRPEGCESVWADRDPDATAATPPTGREDLDGLASRCEEDLQGCDDLRDALEHAAIPDAYHSYGASCGLRVTDRDEMTCDEVYDGRTPGTTSPFTFFGQDPDLDPLVTACGGGEQGLDDCDLLQQQARSRQPAATEYAEFGATCGDRNIDVDDCRTLYGGDTPPISQPFAPLGLAKLDALAAECHDGIATACDGILEEIALLEEALADYEEYASTCGERIEPTAERCYGIFGAATPLPPEDITDIGRVPDLDLAMASCAGGDLAACDDLFGRAPVDSGYSDFAASCGGHAPSATPCMPPPTTPTAPPSASAGAGTAPMETTASPTESPGTDPMAVDITSAPSSTSPPTTAPPATTTAPPATTTAPPPATTTPPPTTAATPTTPSPNTAPPTTLVVTTTTAAPTPPQEMTGPMPCDQVDNSYMLFVKNLELTVDRGHEVIFPDPDLLEAYTRSAPISSSSDACDVTIGLVGTARSVEIIKIDLAYVEGISRWRWRVTPLRTFDDDDDEKLYLNIRPAGAPARPALEADISAAGAPVDWRKWLAGISLVTILTILQIGGYFGRALRWVTSRLRRPTS